MQQNLTQSFGDLHVDGERPAFVASGNQITRSGLLLCGILEDGVEKAKMSTGQPDDVIIGFSEVIVQTQTSGTKKERVMVPALAPFVVQLVRGEVVGFPPTDFDVHVTAVSPARAFRQTLQPSAGCFTCSPRGTLTFSAADAGVIIDIGYRYNLSSQEARDLSAANGTNQGVVIGQIDNQVMVLAGQRQVFTREFDKNVDFSTGRLQAGVDGQITVGGTGVDLTPFMRTIKLPDDQEGLLGLALSLLI